MFQKRVQHIKQGGEDPEKRTRNLEEKALGLDATHWLKDKLEGAIDGDDELTIRTELKGGVGKYGRLLGWLYVGDEQVSLNVGINVKHVLDHWRKTILSGKYP